MHPALPKQLLLALSFLVIGVLSVLQAAAPLHNYRGIPYHRTFTEDDFESSATANFIAVSSDGSIFYCDQSWLFLYDGNTWQKVYDNNGTQKITALHWDDEGHIYAGGYNEICELVLDENNQYQLKELVPKKELNIEQKLEAILSTDSTVYFRGRRDFVCYDKESGTADAHNFDTWVTSGFILDGAYHIVTDENSILRYQDKQFVPAIPELTETINSQEITIASTVVDSQGRLIMASERRGIYRYDGKSVTRAYPNFNPPREQLIREIKLTDDGRLIVASLGGGIIALDEEGSIVDVFDENVDFRFKSARGIAIDHSGTIWGMFNSSIAKILLDSELTPIDERIRPSLFYGTQHLFEDDLYIRSFYKLYRAEFDHANRIEDFEELFFEEDFEVWSVAIGDDAMYINTGDGDIYRWKNDILTRIGQGKTFDRITVPSTRPDLLLGTNSEEIHLYRINGVTLESLQTLPNTGGFINRISEDEDGYLWLEHGFDFVGRISIQENQIELTSFSIEDGLVPDEWLTLWPHQGKMLITHSKGILAFDEATNSFVKDDSILASLEPNAPKRIERAFTDDLGNLWISADGHNVIYWKQPDGSYRYDDTSLSEMGDPYFEFLTHFDNNEALIMTAFEFFHYKPKDSENQSERIVPPTTISQIRSSSDEKLYYQSIGTGTSPAPRRFSFDENSIAFNVANNYSYSTKSPKFQYILEGFSRKGSEEIPELWSNSSNIYFTNLAPGSYTFKARTRLGNSEITPWTSYPFEIAPPFYRTYLAYGIYVVLFALLVQLSVEVYSHRLKKQNLRLEAMVTERTKEIEAKNLELEKQADVLESQNVELANQSREIQLNATELSKALDQLRETQDQLLTTARIAGRAEIATNVLHNVGNVLNSVNVGINNLAQLLARSRVKNLKRLSGMLQENRANLSSFLSEDERGRQVPTYIDQLANVLENEMDSFCQEVSLVEKNVDHIKKIISTQQAHAKNIGVLQKVDIPELIDLALSIAIDEPFRSSFRIEKHFERNIAIESDKHKLLEVLINLIKNAKESIVESGHFPGTLHLTCERLPDGKNIRIRVMDNGQGIEPEHLEKLFTHGFTTKEEGHGFGLHSCANTIKSFGGTLRLTSDGYGKGALATVDLPA